MFPIIPGQPEIGDGPWWIVGKFNTGTVMAPVLVDRIVGALRVFPLEGASAGWIEHWYFVTDTNAGTYAKWSDRYVDTSSGYPIEMFTFKKLASADWPAYAWVDNGPPPPPTSGQFAKYDMFVSVANYARKDLTVTKV